MSAGRLPPRPRLAAHVLARRHVIDGQERVILHDQWRDGVLQIGAREWAVLEAADGTRDCEGIVVAARREGAYARVEAVRELLLALEEQGMLAAGEEADPAGAGVRSEGGGARDEGGARAEARGDARGAAVVAGGDRAGAELATSRRDGGGSASEARAPEARAHAGYVAGGATASPAADGTAASLAHEEPRPDGLKPLVPLPGEDMRCSGAGTCCKLYGTVMLFPQEARRVQSLLPQWRVGEVPQERWFSPVRGSEPGPVLAAIARDGACGFLQADGLCAVHRVGGAEAKPMGCRSFPRIFVDDGVAVHVSAKAECPCMLDPRGGEPEPFVEPGWTDVDALPPTVVVRRLPESIALVAGHAVARPQVRAWISDVAARSVPVDPAATSWAMAGAIDRDRRLPALDEPWSAGPPEAAAVLPWIAALHERAAVRAREHAAWRSERDLVRRTSVALATLTLLLREPEALAEALAVPPEHPEHEARYWRLGVHGYRWIGRTPLVTRLRDEAIRVWLGRSLSAVLDGAPGDPHERAPLALVEAMLRAHGIGGYASDVGQNE